MLLLVACLVRAVEILSLLLGLLDWCGAALVEMPWRAVGNAVCLSKARVVHVARRISWRGDWSPVFCLLVSFNASRAR